MSAFTNRFTDSLPPASASAPITPPVVPKELITKRPTSAPSAGHFTESTITKYRDERHPQLIAQEQKTLQQIAKTSAEQHPSLAE